MNANTAYTRYTWVVLIMVFLVIAAGAVVRMTQSGMGCPDWPTCFGRWIPPTHVSQLPPDFEKYLSKQDIDHSFNPYHTWIEYINRLLGALLGFLIFIHTVWSFRKFRKARPTVFFISLAMLLAVGFQGWLGKKVVDDNLAVVKVTTHMIVALVIAALPVWILAKLRNTKMMAPPYLKILTIISLLMVLVQIVLGTQVREEIDTISSALKYQQRELWIDRLGDELKLHRSFSWLVALSCFFLAIRSALYGPLINHAIIITLALVLGLFTGLVMYFYDIPAIAQPLHLLLASILAISLFSIRLQMK